MQVTFETKKDNDLISLSEVRPGEVFKTIYGATYLMCHRNSWIKDTDNAVWRYQGVMIVYEDSGVPTFCDVPLLAVWGADERIVTEILGKLNFKN